MSSSATAIRIDAISGDDLTRFVVSLKKDHAVGSNTILRNAIIVEQLFKRNSGITRELQLPERISPLPKHYRQEDLARSLRFAPVRSAPCSPRS